MEQPVSWDVAKDFPGEFTLYEDETGIPFKVQWDHENESKVHKNKNGVTGWAWVDGVPNQRVHLCCLTPCPCYHSSAKWGYRPATRHGRLEAPPPPSPTSSPSSSSSSSSSSDDEDPPASVKASAEGTIGDVTPAAEAVGPETAVAVGEGAEGSEGAKASSSSSSSSSDDKDPSAPGTVVDSGCSSTPTDHVMLVSEAIDVATAVAIAEGAEGLNGAEGASMVVLETAVADAEGLDAAVVVAPPSPGELDLSEMSAVAPPPEQVGSGPPRAFIPPPARAELPYWNPAPPLRKEDATPKPMQLMIEDLAGGDSVVMDIDESEEVSIVAYQEDHELAKQVRIYIAETKRPDKTIGLSHFLILALMNRVRLYVWVGLTRCDIVAKYAPWALKAMTSEANCEAIGCKLTRDEFTNEVRLHVAHSEVHINHWVVCLPSTASRGDGADSNLHISDSDANGTLTECFLSVKRHLISTVADGKCGPDAMCIMLGLRRTAMQREALRLDIALFVLKHNANRALISA